MARLVAGFGLAMVMAAATATAGEQAAPATPDADVPPAQMTAGQAVNEINRALVKVDLPLLLDIYQHNPDPIAHVVAATALERVQYNLDKATEDARLCEKELINRRPGIALYCAHLANGNLRLAQGDKAAEAEELDIVKRFAGRAPAAELDGMTTYVNTRRDIPPFRLTKPDGNFSMPLLKASYDQRGAVKLEAANGESARMTLDTGAGTMVMDQDTAEHLGVRAVGIDGRTGAFFSKNIPTQHGVLEKAHIGEITLENVPVEIVPASRHLIGMDILRRLGAFRLTDRDLFVYGKDGQRPACNEPLLISTNVWGNSVRVVTNLSINGTQRITLLDSGSSFYLNGNQSAMDEVNAIYNRRMRIRDVGATHAARVSQATAEVVVSGQPIQMTFGVFRDADLPWSYVLGSGSLGDMDYFFDFDQRHACMLLHDNLH
ncbi:MAG TPA: retropepsin-like aspartic protease [Dyella sp.]|uniref:retropepsin-like aspartic protease n=1 Tax=Dyella sp. TaxID=1869338 RepID=UPI002D76C845|nr:retropepsin-like aspartic protease [Dyella sp.]HET6552751.1 retropepsin-like aspartic protease [Dyella sp.]